MIFTKEELPVIQFSLLGVNLQNARQLPSSELEFLLQGRRTSALKFSLALEGVNKNIILRARLSLSRYSRGGAILIFHPTNKEPENSFGLTPSQIQVLKDHPGIPVTAVNDEKLWSIYLDSRTNEMLGLNLDSVQAPLAINGQRLSEEQEMRFKLGETISISNPNGSETVFKLDPFQNAGIIGRNIDLLEIENDGLVITIPYKGRTLIDNQYLLQQELGCLIILEEALKQQLNETHPDLIIELEQALAEAEEEILQYKYNHDGNISSDEIATILIRHLPSSGVPFSSLESLISSENTSSENNVSDEPIENANEKIHWLTSSKNIDSADNMMLESSTGATIIGILSDEEQEKFTLAIKNLQETIEANKEVLSLFQLQDRILALLQDQLGPRLAVYSKESRLKESEIIPSHKQQLDISQ